MSVILGKLWRSTCLEVSREKDATLRWGPRADGECDSPADTLAAHTPAAEPVRQVRRTQPVKDGRLTVAPHLELARPDL